MSRKIENFCYFLMVCLFVFGVVNYSKALHILAPVYHMDGAFQTASGLFRLDSSQLPGRDFFSYLGIGPILSLMPIFKMMGSDLVASSVSAQATTLLFAWVAVTTLFTLIIRPKTFLEAMAWSAFLLSMALFLKGGEVRFITTPGNSLRPIRSFIPYGIAVLSYLVLRLQKPSWMLLAAALVTAASVLWSNDFAYITALIFGLFWFAYFCFVRRSLSLALLYSIVTVSFAALLLTVFTGGHLLDLLDYNLSVSRDQFWYFLGYNEADKVNSLSQLSRLWPFFDWDIAILVCILLGAGILKRTDLLFCGLIGISLLGGGIIASVGGHLDPAYFGGANFWRRAIIALVVFKLFQELSRRYFSFRAFKMLRPLFVGASLSVLFAYSSYELIKYRQGLSAAAMDPELFFDADLGGFLPIAWKEYLEFIRRNPDVVVNEEYYGVWSAAQKKFPNWKVDAAIHALGSHREFAKRKVAEADFVTTTRFDMTHWQRWCFVQNYWLYRELMRNFKPILQSPNTVVWKKSTVTSVQQKNTSCEVNRESGTYSLFPVPGYRLYEVTLKYETNHSGRDLFLVGNGIFFLDVGEYVSVDPNAGSATFPVYVNQEAMTSFATKVVLRGGEMNLIECTARPIETPDPQVFRTPAFYTKEEARE